MATIPFFFPLENVLGDLYHFNAEEEPENEDYPSKMKLPSGKTFHEVLGPRGVLPARPTAWAAIDRHCLIRGAAPVQNGCDPIATLLRP